jgi:hypothetical protein
MQGIYLRDEKWLERRRNKLGKKTYYRKSIKGEIKI